MKKIILTLILIFISTTSFSQARIFYTESQIRKEFSSSEFVTEYTDEGIRFIYKYDENVVTYYYFDSKGMCYLSAMIPLSQGVLNYFVEDYNSKYVIVSDTEWKFYNQNGIMFIKLINVEGKPTFMYFAKDKSQLNENGNNNGNNNRNQY